MYAEGTSVPIAKSQSEILALIRAHKATEHGVITRERETLIAFAIGGQRFSLGVPTPQLRDFRAGPRVRGRSKSAEDHRTQREREVWRLLALAFKAKFALVDAGISTMEREFLSALLLPNGRTVGAVVREDLEVLAQGGRLNGSLLLLEQNPPPPGGP